MDRGPGQAIVHGVAKSQTQVTKHSTAQVVKKKLYSSSLYGNMAKPMKQELVPSLGLFTLFP